MPRTEPGPSLPITSRDPADEPDRVADARPFIGDARDRDRHLANPGHVDHVELTGLDAVLLLPLVDPETRSGMSPRRASPARPTARSPDADRAGRPVGDTRAEPIG